MKKTLFILMALSAIVACTSRYYGEKTEVPHLYIDINKAEKHMDFSAFLDTSYYRIIPLDTSPECLLGSKIRKVAIRKNRIYVWEEQSNGVFVFDENGKYINKITDQGEGPREYLNIKNVSISDSLISIFDSQGAKILYYDMDCNYISTQSLKDIRKSIYPVAQSFILGDKIYFGVFFRETFRTDKYGVPHKWVSMDLDLNKESVKRFLPYDYDCPTESDSHFSLQDNYYTAINDTVRFMVSNLDTIFVATRDTIVPEYVVDFGDKAVPLHLYKSTYHEAKESSEMENCIDGVEYLYDTDDYLILNFRYGDYSMKEIMESLPVEIRENNDKRQEWLRKHRPTSEHHFILNKKTGETHLANGMNTEAFEHYPTNLRLVDGQYLITSNSMHIYSFDENEKHLPFKRPGNPRYERALNEAYSTVTPMSNPVLHIYKFKDVE